jgi:hypothetical protein
MHHIGVLMPRARRAHQPRAPSKIMNEPMTTSRMPAASSIFDRPIDPVMISAEPHTSTITPPIRRALRPRLSMLHASPERDFDKSDFGASFIWSVGWPNGPQRPPSVPAVSRPTIAAPRAAARISASSARSPTIPRPRRETRIPPIRETQTSGVLPVARCAAARWSPCRASASGPPLPPKPVGRSRCSETR